MGCNRSRNLRFSWLRGLCRLRLRKLCVCEGLGLAVPIKGHGSKCAYPKRQHARPNRRKGLQPLLARSNGLDLGKGILGIEIYSVAHGTVSLCIARATQLGLT